VDYFTCIGRPKTASIDVNNGLPALPELLNPQDTNVDPGIPLDAYVLRMDFPDEPNATDPLMDDVYATAIRHEYKYVHLRWLSASWWCSDDRVVAIHQRLIEGPSKLCGPIQAPR
jgi:hypothetical protein